MANPGETVRFYVIAAGPSFDTDFHVVGTLLNQAWLDGDIPCTSTTSRRRPCPRAAAASST